MNRDSIDDSGKPFHPETPEAFFQRGEEAFQVWWGELDPPGSSGGLELDYETSRAVWSAAYEHRAECIMLVYDGAESNVQLRQACKICAGRNWRVGKGRSERAGRGRNWHGTRPLRYGVNGECVHAEMGGSGCQARDEVPGTSRTTRC
jgi:hypothetical protein